MAFMNGSISSVRQIFTGHSLSVSDVVVLNDGSTVKAYYVDSIGFAELPDFFQGKEYGFAEKKRF